MFWYLSPPLVFLKLFFKKKNNKKIFQLFKYYLSLQKFKIHIMGRTFGKYKIIKRYPDNTEETIHTQMGLEQTLSLLALFEQRFVIDTKIDILKGNISEEEGKELLHKVNFNHIRI